MLRNLPGSRTLVVSACLLGPLLLVGLQEKAEKGAHKKKGEEGRKFRPI
jgi:hypothetical protein